MVFVSPCRLVQGLMDRDSLDCGGFPISDFLEVYTGTLSMRKHDDQAAGGKGENEGHVRLKCAASNYDDVTNLFNYSTWEVPINSISSWRQKSRLSDYPTH